MRLISSMLLATALSLSGGAAFAACPDHSTSAGTDMGTTGSVTKDTSPGAAGHGTENKIAKSGSQAPMEGASQPGTQTYGQPGNKIAKEGKNLPLGTEANRATSQQDVNAQQHGGKTAAATGMDKDCVK
ncbi:hypothetical protein KEU06_26535 [Pseudaminobacter sp. 19-2017]|uniref:Exopolysaccharide production protein YjbE n=1 Tax=Pseudaminobacter soli (ex Zhang et al. 2022) TaxID=2831468 RepID=A0A942I4X5_9HYPH|nr:hypothetical protein [Pseudaminobacter soli]MBS3652159.1 hypothetical protein [Pseudaminobacter soli]